MANPMLVKSALSAVTSKEGRSAGKTVIAVIVIFVCLVVILFGGAVTGVAGYLFGDSGEDDIYYRAKEEIKEENAIENDLSVPLLKLIDILSEVPERTDQTELEQYIREYFITTEEYIPESTESEPADEPELEESFPEESAPEESGTESEPEPVTYTRFKTQDEILAMLTEEPFEFSEEDITALQELLTGAVGTGEFLWPVPSCTAISSPYGYRWGKLHDGTDISGAGIRGAEIVASDDGVVTQTADGYGDGYLGCMDGGGYGNHVFIDHGNGYSTRYGHCLNVVVSAGQEVKKGDVIAYVGTSGNSTGNHLHFEILINGQKVDPMNFFAFLTASADITKNVELARLSGNIDITFQDDKKRLQSLIRQAF